MEHKDMKNSLNMYKSQISMLKDKIDEHKLWRVGNAYRGHGAHSTVGQDMNNLMQYASIPSDLNDHLGLTFSS
jgi:hypothetical protein